MYIMNRDDGSCFWDSVLTELNCSRFVCCFICLVQFIVLLSTIVDREQYVFRLSIQSSGR